MSGNKARHTLQLSAQECRIDFDAQTSFAGLVVLAEEFHPIPFRTRPLKPPAPMVLRLKPRESRSLPVLPRAAFETPSQDLEKPPRETAGAFCFSVGLFC